MKFYFIGNLNVLFVSTGCINGMYERPQPKDRDRQVLNEKNINKNKNGNEKKIKRSKPRDYPTNCEANKNCSNGGPDSNQICSAVGGATCSAVDGSTCSAVDGSTCSGSTCSGLAPNSMFGENSA